MKKILLTMMAVFALVLFSGCGRSNEQISADAKPLVEKVIRTNLNIESTCTRLLDIQRVDGNHYTATAEVQYFQSEMAQRLNMKTTEMLKISIAYDGDTVLVRIEK